MRIPCLKLPTAVSPCRKPSLSVPPTKSPVTIPLQKARSKSSSVSFQPHLAHAARLTKLTEPNASSRRLRRRRPLVGSESPSPRSPMADVPAPPAVAAPVIFRVGVAYDVVPASPLQADSTIFASRWQVVVRGRNVGVFPSAQR